MEDSGDIVLLAGRFSTGKYRKRHLNFTDQFGAHGGIAAAEQNAFLIGPERMRDRIEAAERPEDIYNLLRSYAQ